MVIVLTALLACQGEERSQQGGLPPPASGPVIRLASSEERPVAPPISGEVVGGSHWDLSAQRGKVVLVDFWATWCPPCLRSIPDLIAMQNKFGPRGFEVIGISLDRGGDAIVAPFISRTGINYPVLVDGQARFARSYGGVEAIPTFYLVDRNGRIAAHVVGGRPAETIENAVRSLLAEG
jgi:thiol-disulfide isomerase/thioredoxin